MTPISKMPVDTVHLGTCPIRCGSCIEDFFSSGHADSCFVSLIFLVTFIPFPVSSALHICYYSSIPIRKTNWLGIIYCRGTCFAFVAGSSVYMIWMVQYHLVVTRFLKTKRKISSIWKEKIT